MTPHSLQLDNKNVSIDRFLLFWSQNNQMIVQALIVVTLILIVILVFMTLFGSKDEVLERSGSGGISPDLEKSLQKMLDNQVSAKSAVFDFSKAGEAASQAKPPVVSHAPVGGAASAEILAEVEKMKSEVFVRDRSIQDLKAQLEAAQTDAKKAASSPGSSGLESKVKELEARLAEYDIISEDIADLSRYKEENEKLKKQLSTNSSTPPVAAAPAAPPPVPVAAAPAPVETTVSPIDDDLMKEFAQAVESQKAQTAVAPPPAAAAPTKENEDLMGQFENFVQKKEGS